MDLKKVDFVEALGASIIVMVVAALGFVTGAPELSALVWMLGMVWAAVGLTGTLRRHGWEAYAELVRTVALAEGRRPMHPMLLLLVSVAYWPLLLSGALVDRWGRR